MAESDGNYRNNGSYKRSNAFAKSGMRRSGSLGFGWIWLDSSKFTEGFEVVLVDFVDKVDGNDGKHGTNAPVFRRVESLRYIGTARPENVRFLTG